MAGEMRTHCLRGLDILVDGKKVSKRVEAVCEGEECRICEAVREGGWYPFGCDSCVPSGRKKHVR